MTEFWELKFKEEGAMWKFESSDSAWRALDIFKLNQISKILIPGIGYGRNAKIFIENGIEVTGIEISESAINLAKTNGIYCKIYKGSVVNMPFDKVKYEGVFCYALLHLLNKKERKQFVRNCYNQLKIGGLMIFSVISTQSDLYGKGKKMSKDRFEIMNGLKVFFYDSESINKEFEDFGMIESLDIQEPIKYMEGQDPIKFKFVVCKK